jgi:energy-coupling factor transporter transmembrane protein EcfT
MSKFHFLTILIIGCSATLWAVYDTQIVMPLLWLILLAVWLIFSEPTEFKMFFRRFYRIGLLLLMVSLLQIIFRREGNVLLSIRGIPLVFADGLREAILLWIRYVIIFILAHIFARVSLFEFLLFLNKIKLSFKLSLLLLTTLKFIPFIFNEAKKGIWSIRFRGINLRRLSVKHKYLAFRKLLIPLLYRGIHYASFSSLALELRGYGTTERITIPQAYPLKFRDYALIFFIAIINLFGMIVF